MVVIRDEAVKEHVLREKGNREEKIVALVYSLAVVLLFLGLDYFHFISHYVVEVPKATFLK